MGYQFIRQLKCVFGLLKYIYASFGTLNGDACKSHNSRVHTKKKLYFLIFLFLYFYLFIINNFVEREERSGEKRSR